MKKLLFALAATAATLSVAPAQAAGPIIMQVTPTGSTGSFSYTTTGPSFTDNYTFTVPTTGTVLGSVISINTSGANFVLTSVFLNGVSLLPMFTDLGSGNYLYQANGSAPTIVNPQTLQINSTGAGSYGGNVVFTSGAVPEPATWALMILGFGVVGYGMRRSAKVTYATA